MDFEVEEVEVEAEALLVREIPFKLEFNPVRFKALNWEDRKVNDIFVGDGE